MADVIAGLRLIPPASLPQGGNHAHVNCVAVPRRAAAKAKQEFLNAAMAAGFQFQELRPVRCPCAEGGCGQDYALAQDRGLGSNLQLQRDWHQNARALATVNLPRAPRVPTPVGPHGRGRQRGAACAGWGGRVFQRDPPRW